MKLTKWSINNYKSVKSNCVELDDLTAIIGRNNSGKSNLLESLKIYAHSITGPSNYEDQLEDFSNCIYRADESKSISFQATFSLSEEERKDVWKSIDENPKVVEKLSSLRFAEKIRHSIEFRQSWNLGEASFEVSIDGSFEQVFSRVYLEESSSYTNTMADLEAISNEDIESQSVTYSNSQHRTRHPRNTIPAPFELLSESLSTWNSIGAFREPRNQMKAEMATKLDTDGRNLVQVAHTLQSNRRNLFDLAERRFTSVMDGIKAVETPYKQGSTITISVREENQAEKFDLKEISSGTKEILTLIFGIASSEQSSDLLTIEEPELHLHPEAEQEVYKLISEVTDSSTQIIVATHSDVFVNETQVSSIVRAERDTKTEFRSVSDEDIQEELIDLGYNQSGLLQSKGVVFVEGRSDQIVLKTFAEKLGYDFDNLGISLIPLEGESKMRTHGRSLVKTLFAFNIPYRFIADSDGDEVYEVKKRYVEQINRENTNTDWHTTPEHFLVWSRYDLESYLIECPEAIAEETDLEVEVVQEIIDEHQDSKKKAKVLDKIYAQAYEQLDKGEAYQKDIDGMKIASRTTSVPKEIKEKIEEIVEIVG